LKAWAKAWTAAYWAAKRQDDGSTHTQIPNPGFSGCAARAIARPLAVSTGLSFSCAALCYLPLSAARLRDISPGAVPEIFSKNRFE
jgi:hypothetical protein